MPSRYSIKAGDGGPFLFKGENRIGSLLQWRAEDNGLAVIAGTFSSVFHLNDENCDLPAIKKLLSSMITSAS